MWAAIAVVSLIISVALSVDVATASRIAKDKKSAVAKKAAALQSQMAKDSNLIAQLLDAYNRKDSRLAADIIYSSPFGTRFQQMKKEIKDTKSEIDRLSKVQREQADERARVESELSKADAKSQTSGSVIGDLVAGGIDRFKSNVQHYTDDPTRGIEYHPSDIQNKGQ